MRELWVDEQAGNLTICLSVYRSVAGEGDDGVDDERDRVADGERSRA